MICEEAMALMSAKLDGELTPEQEARLTEHLAACPACDNLMKTLSGLDSQLAELREPAPEGLKTGVLYRIDQATGKAKSVRRRWFGPGTAIGAVAAVLVLLVGLGVVPLGERMKDQAAEPVMTCEAAEDKNLVSKSEAFNRYDGSEIMQYAGGQSDQFSTQAPAATEPAHRAPTVPCEVAGKNAVDGEPLLLFVTEAEETACAALSRTEEAAVLLYTEFTPDSLFGMLESEEPRLYALMAELEPETRDGLVCYKTDCGTVLALQEWFLSRLPTDKSTEAAEADDSSAMKAQLEALDPGSTSLYRIITWDSAKQVVSWPADWAPDWAERMRDQENWRLFFPDEDYVPNGEKTAYLVFPGN